MLVIFTYFKPSCVCIVDFEQVNVSWEDITRMIDKMFIIYFLIKKILTNAWFIRHLKNKNKSPVGDYGFSTYAKFFEQLETRGLTYDFSQQVTFSIIHISPITLPAWVLFLNSAPNQ